MKYPCQNHNDCTKYGLKGGQVGCYYLNTKRGVCKPNIKICKSRADCPQEHKCGNKRGRADGICIFQGKPHGKYKVALNIRPRLAAKKRKGEKANSDHTSLDDYFAVPYIEEADDDADDDDHDTIEVDTIEDDDAEKVEEQVESKHASSSQEREMKTSDGTCCTIS